MEKKKHNPSEKQFTIDLAKGGLSQCSVDPTEPIDNWPFEVKLEFLNMMRLFRAVGLLSETVYQKKYAALCDKYDEDMIFTLQFLD